MPSSIHAAITANTDGLCWTRFEQTKGDWVPVPADVVIKDPNRNGPPVAWWYYQDGKLQIRCYAPGGGVS